MQYQIGDFSRISRLSIKTLRFYHENGLLEPCYIDHESGYRYYTEKELETTRIIKRLKDLGFSLREIRQIIDSCQDDSELINYLAAKYQEITENIEKYQTIQEELAFHIRQIREKGEVKEMHPDLNQEIVIKKIPDRFIASIRFKGSYSEITKYLGELYKHCTRYAAGLPMALYYDEGFKEEDADIEVGLPVKKAFDIDGIHSRILKGGEALSVIHRGAYETLGESYKVVIDYINTKHMKMYTPCQEIYLKGPGIILPRNPKKFITEIRIFTTNN
jgi:Predicted transcriptional regulators